MLLPFLLRATPPPHTHEHVCISTQTCKSAHLPYPPVITLYSLRQSLRCLLCEDFSLLPSDWGTSSSLVLPLHTSKETPNFFKGNFLFTNFKTVRSKRAGRMLILLRLQTQILCMFLNLCEMNDLLNLFLGGQISKSGRHFCPHIFPLSDLSTWRFLLQRRSSCRQNTEQFRRQTPETHYLGLKLGSPI